MGSKHYEEVMIETYIYLSEPVDVHTIRSIISAKMPESPRDFNVWADDYLVVELEYDPSGLPLVEKDSWSYDGPYLDEVACWGRIRVTAWDSVAKASVTNAILPLMWLSPYLDQNGIGYRWHDPFSMRTNSGFDLYDVVLYHESAEMLSV